MSLITDTLIPVTRLTLALLAGCVLITQGQPQQPSRRTWTNFRGNSIKATFIGLGGQDVVLQLPNGALSTVLLSDLSQADQLYVQSLTGLPAPAPESAASNAGLVSYSPPGNAPPLPKSPGRTAIPETRETVLNSAGPAGKWEPIPTAQFPLKETGKNPSPWSFPGFERLIPLFARETASTLTFSSLQADLQKEIRAGLARGCRPDKERLLSCLNETKADSEQPGGLSKKDLKDRQFDSMLLVYYFAFLDGENSYTALHNYCASLPPVSEKGAAPSSKPGTAITSELVEKLRAGRTDEQLSAAMTVGFSVLGVRF